MSTIWRISKQSVVNSFNGILLNNKNKQTTITCNNVDESQRHYIFCFYLFIYLNIFRSDIG